MRDLDGARVCSIQGDYANMQCLAPCRQEVWPSRPDVERLVAVTDPVTQQITDPQVFPDVGSAAATYFWNVRAGSWFLDAPYLTALRDLSMWVRNARDTRTLTLDIGAGFNTPSVVRWPM
jgi:hypothetical protein